MNRFFKLTAIFALTASFSLLANQGFAKGKTKVRAPQTHKHRINEHPGDSNPDKDPNWPTNNPPPGGPPVGPPVGPPKPTKPHPIAGVPTGADKAIL